MLREMGTFGAVMTVILLVLIAIKSILHYLNPKGENNDQTKRYRKHRRFVFGFLSIATLILGAYIITSIKNPELFQKINESTTPGFIYGSRLLVKLLATVAGMSIIAMLLHRKTVTSQRRPLQKLRQILNRLWKMSRQSLRMLKRI